MFAKLVLVQVFLIAAVLAWATASGIPTPTHLAGGQIVSVDDARRLLEASAAQFIDVRRDTGEGLGHIPGAQFVGYFGDSANATDFDSSQDRFDLSKLPADRESPVVFYGHSDTGWKSYKAALTAIRAEYTNVLWMRQGIAGWLERAYPIER